MSLTLSLLILGTLVGALGSSMIGALSDRRWVHSFSMSLLVLSGIAGVVAGGGTFLSGEPTVLTIAHLFYQASFVLDGFSAIFFTLISGVTAVCAFYGIWYGDQSRTEYPLRAMNTATGLFVLGMLLVTLAFTPIGFFFGWELMSLSSFFLVMIDRKPESVQAAIQYLVMTHLGAFAILAGFFLLSQGAIFSSFSVIAGSVAQISAPVLTVAMALFLFGFGSKAGLVPFHVWLPLAHPQAPSPISALMSGVMLKVAVYGFLRVFIFLFPMVPPAFALIIIGVGLLSALYGVLYAVIDRDLKRTLAYSSIENLGLIFTMIGVSFFAMNHGLVLLANTALLAALFHSIAHGLFKSGLFLTAGVIVHATHTRDLEQMGGLAKRWPLVSGIFCVLVLAAAALPPFGPFYGEWMFLQALVGSFSQVEPVVLSVLIGVLSLVALVAGLAVFAMVKLFAISMLGEPRSQAAAQVHTPHRGLIASILVLALGLVLMGLFAPRLIESLGGGWLINTGGLSFSSESSPLIPWLLFVLIGAVIGMSWLVKRVFGNPTERLYHTWDCGQPITAQMEYTATAFSGPIRFFFRLILRTHKQVTTTPVVATNPWIATRSIVIDLRSIWVDYLYTPLARGFVWTSTKMKQLQNGNIQFYLLLLFFTLFVTLVLAL